jgi:short-subunit dehydrogenase
MNNKVIWITGASTGIGKEMACAFSKAGYIVVVTGRRKSRLVNLVSEIKFAGREASAFVCNVASERSVQSTTKRIFEKYGRIDCLINNAGVSVFKNFLDTKVFDYDYVMDINLRGSFLCMKSVLKRMIKLRRGHIINVLSVAATTVLDNSSVYACSKAGLLALSNSVRKEVRKYNIKITNILPGAVETAMWDAKTRQKYKNRMMSPEDVANIALQTFEQPKKVLIEDIVVRPLKGDL